MKNESRIQFNARRQMRVIQRFYTEVFVEENDAYADDLIKYLEKLIDTTKQQKADIERRIEEMDAANA